MGAGIWPALPPRRTFFWNEEENPTPLETDLELELESIRASAWKGFLLGNSLLLGISLLQIFLFAMLYLEIPSISYPILC